VARNLVSPADAAGGEYDRLGREEDEAAALPLVAERAGDAVPIFEERRDRALHVDRDPSMDTVILERADHLQAGAIAAATESRVLVAAEIALQDAAVGGAVKEGPPGPRLA